MVNFPPKLGVAITIVTSFNGSSATVFSPYCRVLVWYNLPFVPYGIYCAGIKALIEHRFIRKTNHCFTYLKLLLPLKDLACPELLFGIRKFPIIAVQKRTTIQSRVISPTDLPSKAKTLFLKRDVFQTSLFFLCVLLKIFINIDVKIVILSINFTFKYNFKILILLLSEILYIHLWNEYRVWVNFLSNGLLHILLVFNG